MITSSAPPDPSAHHRARVGAIVFIGIFGFLAGIIGGLVVVAVLPTATIIGPFIASTTATRLPATRGPLPPPIARAISASVVDVFTVDASSIPPLLPLSARTGRGVALTSDGWVATVRAAVPTLVGRGDRRVPVVVGVNRTIRSVDRVITDPISDLVFLHLIALDAAVLPIRERRDVDIGTFAYLPTPDGGIATTSVRSLHAKAAAAERVSDRWTTTIALTDDPDAAPGTPVVDASGGLIGLVRDDRSVIPADAVRSALPALFARGRIERNGLGMTYRDATDFAYGSSAALDGITVLTTGRGSAAAALRPGDRITAIDEDALTVRRQLVDVLQEYPIGTTVELRVVRDGNAIVIPITPTVLRGESLLVTAIPAPAAAAP